MQTPDASELHPLEDVYGTDKPRGYVNVHLPLSRDALAHWRCLARFHETNLWMCFSDAMHHAMLHNLPTIQAIPTPKRRPTGKKILVSKRVRTLLGKHFRKQPAQLHRFMMWLLQHELKTIGRWVDCLCGCGVRIHPFVKLGRPRWFLPGHQAYLQGRPREERVLRILSSHGPIPSDEVARILGQDPKSTSNFLGELAQCRIIERTAPGYFALPAP